MLAHWLLLMMFPCNNDFDLTVSQRFCDSGILLHLRKYCKGVFVLVFHVQPIYVLEDLSQDVHLRDAALVSAERTAHNADPDPKRGEKTYLFEKCLVSTTLKTIQISQTNDKEVDDHEIFYT